MSRVDGDVLEAQQAIERLLADCVAGWNDGDLDRFMAIYDEGPGTIFVGNGTISKGYAGIRARYAPYFAALKPGANNTLKIEVLDFMPLGTDYVLLTARNELKHPSGGSSGFSSAVFHRTDTGWRIVSDHS